MYEIGIMANFNKPTELAKITSLIAKSYGIEIIYMRPQDVIIEERKVNGKVLTKNKWIQRKTDIPKFIDVAPYCFKKKYKEIMDFLRETTFLSDDRSNVISKEMLQDILSNDQEFAQLMIPTHGITTYKDLHDYLAQYDKVVLKPGRGLRGRGIYFIETVGQDSFRIGFQTSTWTVDLNKLREFFNENIKGKNYILQKYVTSRTPQGDPFDCRVHVEKDGSGEWSIARIYVRIGIGQSIISNVNQGGGISEPIPFLKANFKDNWQEIYKGLLNLGEIIPRKMEQLRKTHIMSLGMDVGIDKNGKLYLFEVNDGPSTLALISEVAFHRSNYYVYILKYKLNIPVESPFNAIESNHSTILKLRKDVEKKEKQMDEILNSTSWKITSFIREIGKFIK